MGREEIFKRNRDWFKMLLAINAVFLLGHFTDISSILFLNIGYCLSTLVKCIEEVKKEIREQKEIVEKEVDKRCR